jgi:hypothetical protein
VAHGLLETTAMKLFHTIVVVGAAMTASSCNMEPVDANGPPDMDHFPDFAHFVIIDMPFPTIAVDLAHFNIIDAGNVD